MHVAASHNFFVALTCSFAAITVLTLRTVYAVHGSNAVCYLSRQC